MLIDLNKASWESYTAFRGRYSFGERAVAMGSGLFVVLLVVLALVDLVAVSSGFGAAGGTSSGSPVLVLGRTCSDGPVPLLTNLLS